MMKLKQIMFALVAMMSCFGFTANAQVAMVGDTKYETIDEAIANWTNGTTLTLLADVTLSGVIKLSSTEHHILDLGTHTMTAAKKQTTDWLGRPKEEKQHAIEIVCNERSSASYALTVNADATNPGGITAEGKSCIYYKKSGSAKDRPIILINNGVFNGSYSINSTSNGNTNCPQIWINGGTFNANIALTKNLLKITGGTFDCDIYATGDTNAYRLISGGKFKSWSFMTADAETKFTIGSEKGKYDKGIYVDKKGWFVVGGDPITELSSKYQAKSTDLSSYYFLNPSKIYYLNYSSAATYGLYYEDADMAIKKHGAANVTVWTKPAVTIPENVTGDAAVVEEIKNNTALKDYTPENLPAGAELEIVLESVGETIVYDVTPMANGAEVEPTEAITFRLPVPASVTETLAKVYHEGELMGVYDIQGEGSAKYVEVSSADFSEFAVEPIVPVAQIGTEKYATLADAVAAAQNGETIILIADVELTAQVEIPAGKVLTLDLNGKTVNSVFNGTSTTNHIYALSNKGTLTINDSSKGNGSINSRGIYNYGSLTLNAGAINAIDGNGGYAVNNQSGSTFVMNGGVVAATNEDDHQSSSGGYDATALKVPADCTATLNGGTINNVCDFTYAIDAAGTLNIPETSTITVNGTHGAIYVSGGETTINAGTYTIPEDNYSRTDNVLYVSGGSLVVNGGTFIGDSDTASGGSCLCDEAGKAVVNGGTFKGSSGGDVWGTTGTTIKGGTFENLIEKQHIADGYEMNENGEVVEAVKEVKVATLAELQAALADNSNELPIIITETIVIPEGETVVLDLNGKTVTRQDEATKYAINNLGTLTIQDTKGNGSINARGIYNGYGDGGANVATAKITVLSGTINAKGTNGGAAIFNYGTANVNAGTFTSIGGYSLNNQAGSSMAISDGVTANNGIYVSGATLVVNGGEINGNRSGCHVLYAWNSTVTINGGEFYNNNSGNSTIMAAGTTKMTIDGGTFGIKDGRVPGNGNTWTSCLTDTQNSATMTVNGGTFNGGFRVQGGTTMTIAGGEFNDCGGSGYGIYGTAIVKGGTFTDAAAQKFATDNLAAGYELGVDGTVVKMAALLGSGTEADPYQINSVEDLIFFRNKVDEQSQDGSTQYAGKYIKLNADIDLAGINWNPIGSMSGDHGSFKGVFDGGDHTISNLNVEQSGNGLGLFAYTTGNAVIKNLKLVNVTVKSTDNSNYVGGVVGNAYADTKIENVHVSGDVHISGRGYIGGIAGHGYVKMDNVSVVANEGGLITSTFWCAGGVLGYAGEGSTDIKNAHVEGLKITSAAGGLGAIVGMAEDNNGTQPISGSNLSAENVEIKTYTGAYGDSYSNYALGYLYGGNSTSKLTGNLSVENVAITTSNGVTPEVNDAVASIDGTIYFNLQTAIEAVAEGEKITVLRDVIFTTGANGSTNGISYTRGVSFTLDLNGKTITSNLGNNALRFKIGDGNNVTGKEVTVNIQNGKIVSGSNNRCAISAATADNSSNKLIMNLSNLQVEANKVGDFAVKSWTGAVINTTNVDITANYAGGFYACGGEIVLDNESSVAQKGLHTAPYMSYAFGVSSGTGKMTINGGIYSAVPAATTDAYNQGVSHGSSVGGVMSSGGTLIINGGTFSNDNFGEAAPTAPRSLLMADAGAVVTINGGTFNAMAKIVDPTNNTGVASKNAQVTIAGGTYSANPTDTLYNLVKLAEGYMTVENNGVWTVEQAAAKVGETLYATVQAAINAAKDGDVVEIFAGEYGAIDISNKNITIQGAVGADGELLTTIKGGNPAVTAHGFNGTIKDIKIVDAFKVMYAEPAGNVTVDNIYVTGATYGLHLVAYSTDLTWTIQNSYMDLSWANSFGVYDSGDAAVVIEGNKFESTDPYYPDYGALLVNTFLPNVTVQNNIFGANTKIMIRESVSDLSDVTISKNYHADGFENAFVEDSQKADIDSYYKAVAEDGTLKDLVNVVNSLEGEGTEASPYLISSVDELVFFRDHVNAGKTKYNAEGVYVALGADIDLAGVNWVGIGSATAEHGFMGNFDGKNFKIKNLTITVPALDSDGYAYAGLFAITEGTDKDRQNIVKNLTIENVTINTTGHIVAAAIAYPYYTIVENVKVCGDIAIKGGNYTAGALAYTRRCVNASNIAVSGNEGSYITGAQVVGGVISDIQMNGGLVAEYSNFSAEGVTVSGTKNVGGISGIIATQTLNGATVKNVTLVSDDVRVGIVAGCLGGTSTISNITTENVAGATALLGATYEGNAIEAKIKDTYFATVENAMASNVDGVVDIFTDVTINDADGYTYTKDAMVNGTLTYKRTLASDLYNALYVPFEIPVGEFSDKYEFYYFNDVHSDINGVPTSFEIVKITKGTLKANHPYLVKPIDAEDKNMVLEITGAQLRSTTEKQYVVDCSSAYTLFTVRGTYSVLNGADYPGCYGMSVDGDLALIGSGKLGAFRIYLQITDRDTEKPVILPNVNNIRLRVIGEGSGDTTDIKYYDVENQNVELIFDLQGRRVLEPKKGVIYVINGKKVIF